MICYSSPHPIQIKYLCPILSLTIPYIEFPLQQLNLHTNLIHVMLLISTSFFTVLSSWNILLKVFSTTKLCKIQDSLFV